MSEKRTDLQLMDLQHALLSYGAKQAEIVSNNPKLLKATFDLLKSIEKADFLGGAATFTSTASSAAKSANATKSVQEGARAASLVMSTFNTSRSLASVAKLSSPGAVMVFVGAATVQKTGLAVSFAAGDSEKAACVGAIMELAGSVTVTALAVPTGVLLALSLASLTASVWNAHQVCNAKSR